MNLINIRTAELKYSAHWFPYEFYAMLNKYLDEYMVLI